MRSPLMLAVAQPRCHPGDIEANAIEHARIVSSAQARVVVFPELSLTGYHFDAEPISPDDPRLAPLVESCAHHRVVALAGAPVASTQGRHIAVLTVADGGAAVAYHKMFLGEAEAATFTAGSDPAVVEVDGWRLGLAVCKDTGVPAHAEATAALGVDVYTAGVLESIDDAGIQPARASAIVDRHRLWVAIASFAGSTGEGYDRAAGGSAIWQPDGSPTAEAGSEPGEWVAARIDQSS